MIYGYGKYHEMKYALSVLLIQILHMYFVKSKIDEGVPKSCMFQDTGHDFILNWLSYACYYRDLKIADTYSLA